MQLSHQCQREVLSKLLGHPVRALDLNRMDWVLVISEINPSFLSDEISAMTLPDANIISVKYDHHTAKFHHHLPPRDSSLA